jgi:alpha-L-rhamnosidase
VAGIDRVAATVDSALGAIAVEWTTDGGTFTARYSLPFGVTATFHPPVEEEATFTVDGSTVSGPVALGPGQHEVILPSAQIISPAVPSLR